MGGIADDLRESFRLLSRDGRFSLLVVLLLGLGVGATTSIFAVFDALLLRPLPVSHPDSLVRLVQDKVRLGPRSAFRYSVAKVLMDHSRSLGRIAAICQFNTGYRDGDRVERVRTEFASASYFALFEAHPKIGRVLQPEDEQPNVATLPAVLSFGFWQRRYGGNDNVLGRKVLINNQPFVIAGVTRKEFHGAAVETSADLWAPIRGIELLYPDRKTSEEVIPYEIFARLRKGVSLEQARDESYSLFRSTIEKELAGSGREIELLREWELSGVFRLEPIPRGVSRLRAQFSGALQFLIVAAGLLFLMAAASVAGLLLARYAARDRESFIRLAIGASPGRLIRVAILESLLLAGAGGTLGAILTTAVAGVVPRFLPPVRLLDATTVPLALRVELDGRVLAFLFLSMLTAAVLTSLAPAVKIAYAHPGPGLRAARHPARPRGRSLLVVLQIALCTALLVAAGQLAFTLRNLRNTDPGFATGHIVSFGVDPSLTGGDGKQMGRLIESWKEQVKAIPGVRTASLSVRPLLHGTGIKTTVAPVGQRAPRSDFLNTSVHEVTDEYFDTLGLRFLSGRNFQPDDFRSTRREPNQPRPVIVNQAFVDHFFAGESALGKHFGTGVEVEVKPQYQIVGVVTNAKYRSLREPLQPTMYSPLVVGDSQAVLHIRTDIAPAALIRPVREILRKLAPELPIYEIATIDQDIEDSLAGEKLVADLAISFSFLAVLIVAVGLFGLLSFVVTQRTREIGIRIAVGAQPLNILKLISAQTLLLAGAGMGIGLLGSYFAGRALASLLYEVSARDPSVWSVAAVVILTITVLATAVPTIRALRIQPATALREDG